MESIKLHSHAGPDGILRLEIPVGLSNADFEVMVILQPVEKANAGVSGSDTKPTAERPGWPPDLFEQPAPKREEAPIPQRPEPELPLDLREEILRKFTDQTQS